MSFDLSDRSYPNTYAPKINIASDIITVIFRPSSSMAKNMKKAPKKPPAESMYCHVSARDQGDGGGSQSYRY
jgi:hypothetical protein